MNSWHDRGITLSHAHRLQQFEIADWLLEGIQQLSATEALQLAGKRSRNMLGRRFSLGSQLQNTSLLLFE